MTDSGRKGMMVGKKAFTVLGAFVVLVGLSACAGEGYKSGVDVGSGAGKQTTLYTVFHPFGGDTVAAAGDVVKDCSDEVVPAGYPIPVGFTVVYSDDTYSDVVRVNCAWGAVNETELGDYYESVIDD